MSRKLRNWIRRLWGWLGEGSKVFKLALGPFAALVLTSLFVASSEAWIRYSGLVSQVFGTILVISGLWKIRTHYGYPSYPRAFLDWIKRIPRCRVRDEVIGSLVASAEGTTLVAAAEVGNSDDRNQPPEVRIDAIARNVETLRATVRGHRSQLQELARTSEVEGRRTERRFQEVESAIREDLKDVNTSNLLTSLIGVLWILIGALLTSLAPEIWRLLE